MPVLAPLDFCMVAPFQAAAELRVQRCHHPCHTLAKSQAELGTQALAQVPLLMVVRAAY
jgi:hypothetical protein